MITTQSNSCLRSTQRKILKTICSYYTVKELTGLEICRNGKDIEQLLRACPRSSYKVPKQSRKPFVLYKSLHNFAKSFVKLWAGINNHITSVIMYAILCHGNWGGVEETWRQCPQISSTGRWSWFVLAAPDARCCSRSGARTFEHHTRALLLHHSPSPLLLWNNVFPEQSRFC